ncbi:hypothetical protein ACTWQB_09445 [Piscibacillus sp. B03]|uniref:hypothetical protein n=1 Tax=Piscibacillus sp. B03 TaxID=3457430 RepID=UPI003FCDA830
MSKDNLDLVDNITDAACEKQLTLDVSDELALLRDEVENIDLKSKADVMITMPHVIRKVRMLDELLRKNAEVLDELLETAVKQVLEQKEEA